MNKLNRISLTFTLIGGLAFTGTVSAASAQEAVPPPVDINTLITIGANRDRAAALKLSLADQKELAELSVEAPSLATTTLSAQMVEGINKTPVGEPIKLDVSSAAQAANTLALQEQVKASKASSQTCFIGKSTKIGRNYAGNRLWQSWLEHYTCYNSKGTITSTEVLSTGGSTHWIAWSYSGVLNKASKIISNEGRNYAQHAFHYGGIGSVGVIQNKYPCNSADGKTGVFPNGKRYGLTHAADFCGLSR